MKKIITYILLAFIFLVSCNSVEPEEVETYPPGSRNYEWEMILLNENAPFNSYTKIWGSLPSDIWIIGSAGDFDKTILKFDGNDVYNYGQLSINPRSVFGILKHEVWFTGTEFDFWKYDGNNISIFSTHTLPGYSNSYLGDIWGEKSDHLYAVGSVIEDSTGKVKNLIMHYNGSQWHYSVYPNNELQFLSIRKGNNESKFYLVGYDVTINASNFYEFDGLNVKLISVGNETNSSKAITILDNYVYFNNDKEIYKSLNNKIIFFTSLKNSTADGTKIWGRNEKDFFIQTLDGIGHYNGNNLETLFDIKGNFGIFDGLIFSNDVFFIGYYKDTFKFFLIHGKRT